MLDTLFRSGALVHPVDSDVPNTVDLFGALALASGAVHVLNRPGATDHVPSLASTFADTEHVVVIVADGLGLSSLEHAPVGGFLRSHLVRELRTVYPSTTTVALSAFATAGWPATHGLTGWWTRFPAHDRNLAILPFVEQGSGTSAVEFGLSATDLICAEPVWRHLLRDVVIVLPLSIGTGSYNTWFHRGVAAVKRCEEARLPRMVRSVLSRTRRPTYIYSYIPTVDTISHRHGPDSAEAAAAVGFVEQIAERTVREATRFGARVVLTADHGQVTTPRDKHIVVTPDDPVTRLFAALPSGDTRSVQLWFRPESRGDGERRIMEFLADRGAGDDVVYVETGDLIASGLLGPVAPSDEVRRRWGDATLIALGDRCFEYATPRMPPKRFLGNHSGLSPAEMRVPMVVW